MQLLADVVRSGFVEGHHHGLLIGVRAGQTAVSAGPVSEPFLARSTLKPLQAVGMLRAGLDLDPELLALACASHSGEDQHIAGVHRILADAGLSTDDLENAPQDPLDPKVRGIHDRIHACCSGKHAAMLATCVVAGWPTQGYVDPAHPLQQALRATIEDLTGDTATHVAVDGCGAPAWAITPLGLARAFVRIGTERELAPVADAMLEWPEMVAGTGREATTLLKAGLLAKDGAEGVFAVADRTGSALVVKVDDGALRACVPVLAANAKAVGIAWPRHLKAPPLTGGGRPVGEVVAHVVGVTP